MNFTDLLVFLGLMGSVFCNPIPTCDPNCHFTNTFHRLNFMHVSKLRNSSVAPWELKPQPLPGRELETIQSAECKGCTLNMINMIAKPIDIQIWVDKELSGTEGFCRCPLKVAVGCTCVRK